MEDTVEVVRKYVRLREKQRELQGRADALKQEADELEQRVLDAFAEQSVDRMTVDGHTVYLHEQLWAGAGEGFDSTDLAAALRAAGQEHMVAERVNSNTLSAYVRELVREDEPLPDALAPVVRVTRKHSARVRRAG